MEAAVKAAFERGGIEAALSVCAGGGSSPQTAVAAPPPLTFESCRAEEEEEEEETEVEVAAQSRTVSFAFPAASPRETKRDKPTFDPSRSFWLDERTGTLTSNVGACDPYRAVQSLAHDEIRRVGPFFLTSGDAAIAVTRAFERGGIEAALAACAGGSAEENCAAALARDASATAAAVAADSTAVVEATVADADAALAATAAPPTPRVFEGDADVVDAAREDDRADGRADDDDDENVAADDEQADAPLATCAPEAEAEQLRGRPASDSLSLSLSDSLPLILSLSSLSLSR